MDNYGRGPMYQVILWNKLHENPVTNKNAHKAIRNRETIRELDRQTSPVYRKHYTAPGPVKGQTRCFRLAPLLARQEVPYQDQNDTRTIKYVSDANTWTADISKSSVIPDFPVRMSSRQTWLSQCSTVPSKQASLTVVTPTLTAASPPANSPLPVSPLPSSRKSDTSFTTMDSESITPFPVFRRRSPTEQLLLRRPTIEQSLPLTIDEELFEAFAKTIHLQPLPFKKVIDSYKFYQSNFPLLLRKMSDNVRSASQNRRSKTPESPMSIMIARKRRLNERLVELECMMDIMEKETEDIKFVTELNDSVFNPTTWPWNKIDVNSLRRRYTIDASLRFM